MKKRDDGGQKVPDGSSQQPAPVTRRAAVKQGFFAGAAWVVVSGWGKPSVEGVTTPQHADGAFIAVSPTTAQPTTAQPTTAQPTTAQPTTAQPTTAQPTTAQPTTAHPTIPTTAQPTTAQPTGSGGGGLENILPVPVLSPAGLAATGAALAGSAAYALGLRRPAPTMAIPTPSPTPPVSHVDAGVAASSQAGWSPSNVPVRAPGFVLEQIQGEILLFTPGSDASLLLSETAALVWSLCDGRASVEDIVRRLQEAYPEAADQVSGDVLATLKMLSGQNAIVVTN